MKKTNTLRLLDLLSKSKDLIVESMPSSYLITHTSVEGEPKVIAEICIDCNGDISDVAYFLSGATNTALAKIDMNKLLTLSGFVTNLISLTEDIK